MAVLIFNLGSFLLGGVDVIVSYLFKQNNISPLFIRKNKCFGKLCTYAIIVLCIDHCQ